MCFVASTANPTSTREVGQVAKALVVSDIVTSEKVSGECPVPPSEVRSYLRLMSEGKRHDRQTPKWYSYCVFLSDSGSAPQ